MSHNLAKRADGTHAFFSLREPGWHKLGQVVERPVTDDEAIKLAGLDWEVDLRPILRNDMMPIESHVAVVRHDTDATFGVVGKNYTPLQNVELFKTLRGLEGVGDVVIETAGAIGDGEVVWALARVKGLHFDIKGSEHQGYISLTNSHDGSRKLLWTPTDVRQVCWNTTSMIIAQERKNTLSSGWEIPHRSGLQTNLKRIVELYEKMAGDWKNTQEVLTFLASKPITDEKLKRLFVEPFIPKAKQETMIIEAPEAAEVEAEAEVEADESVRAKLIRAEREARLKELLASPTNNMPGTRDTLYAAYNAVTEFVDHETMVRPKDNSDRGIAEARLKSAQFGGRGTEIKRKAFNLAMELADTSA
jgi:phage/plasmid-like protein (TIGR03299 family)